MTAPNLVAPTTISAKTATLAVTDSLSAIVTASPAGSIVRLASLVVSNVDATTPYTVGVQFNRSAGASTAYLVKNLSIPAGTNVLLIGRDAPIYLEGATGDTLLLIASANSKIEAVCSYELVV
jgi:hypothetical protein